MTQETTLRGFNEEWNLGIVEESNSSWSERGLLVFSSSNLYLRDPAGELRRESVNFRGQWALSPLIGPVGSRYVTAVRLGLRFPKSGIAAIRINLLSRM